MRSILFRFTYDYRSAPLQLTGLYIKTGLLFGIAKIVILTFTRADMFSCDTHIAQHVFGQGMLFQFPARNIFLIHVPLRAIWEGRLDHSYGWFRSQGKITPVTTVDLYNNFSNE